MIAQLLRSIQGRLLLLGALVAAAFAATAWYAWSTLTAVKITGESYQQIIRGKDVISDLEPPALNVIRSYLVVAGMEPGEKAETQAPKLERLAKERSEFLAAVDKWTKALPAGSRERAVLTDKVAPLGKEFHEAVVNDFLPALKGADKAAPAKLLAEKLVPLQKRQIEAVAEMNGAAKEALAAEEAAAKAMIDSRTWATAAIGVVALAVAIAGLLAVARGVHRKTADTIATVRAIAAGDYSRKMAEGADEFGRVGGEVNQMAETLRQVAEIQKSQAIIEFKPDGTIMAANEKFLAAMGYSLAEIKGQHHRMFADAALAQTQEYRDFWARLNRGESAAGEFRRLGKGGREVYLQATYNAILDRDGKPLKVVKYATDVTAQVKLRLDIQRVLKEVGESSAALATASQELTATSQQLAATAEETSAQANTAAAAAEQVSSNVGTVAAGAEQMGASIKEIARNAGEAARVASGAVKVAESTNATIAKLGESSAEIGNVVKVITTIAQQTNLLALNATIEAARAGEAGKGFAVVANEVKELAKQTAKATEDIGRKIEAIQADTAGAVQAIGRIGAVIGQINDIQNSIASAVEEQTATTGEINRNIGEAARGSGEIARNVAGVATAARGATEGASDAKRAADELSRLAAALERLVAQYKY